MTVFVISYSKAAYKFGYIFNIFISPERRFFLWHSLSMLTAKTTTLYVCAFFWLMLIINVIVICFFVTMNKSWYSSYNIIFKEHVKICQYFELHSSFCEYIPMKTLRALPSFQRFKSIFSIHVSLKVWKNSQQCQNVCQVKEILILSSNFYIKFVTYFMRTPLVLL